MSRNWLVSCLIDFSSIGLSTYLYKYLYSKYLNSKVATSVFLNRYRFIFKQIQIYFELQLLRNKQTFKIYNFFDSLLLSLLPQVFNMFEKPLRNN